MRILHIIDGIKKVAGTSTFVINVVEGLGRLGQDAHLVSDTEGLSAVNEKVDIVHIHGLWTPLLHRASLFAHRCGARVVWSLHGMTSPWAMRHKWWKKLPAWLLFQKRDLRKAHLLHATTKLEATWNRMVGLGNSQVIVPLGTDLPVDQVNVSARDCRELKMLFVGRIHPVKGLPNLIEAMGLLRGIPLKLRVVGPCQDGHKSDLAELARNVGVSECIEWVGPEYGAELAREYVACDVLVLPSHTENFGGVVVDAMAHSKPVIASTCTPWDGLQTHHCGWWVDNSQDSLADAIRTVAGLSPEERALMGANGRKWVEEEFTWHAVAKKLLESYMGLLQTEGKSI